MLARTWITLGTVSLLLVASTIGGVSHAWYQRQRRSALSRYYWERGCCYRVQIEKGGSLTKTKVASPEGLCPNIDWEHRQSGMEWRAVVDCHYDSCTADSILAKTQRRVTSYVGAGPSREDGCQNAEQYLRDAIRSMRCQATTCTCQKADFHVAMP